MLSVPRRGKPTITYCVSMSFCILMQKPSQWSTLKSAQCQVTGSNANKQTAYIARWNKGRGADELWAQCFDQRNQTLHRTISPWYSICDAGFSRITEGDNMFYTLITLVVNALKMTWSRHVVRMRQIRESCKISDETPKGKNKFTIINRVFLWR